MHFNSVVSQQTWLSEESKTLMVGIVHTAGNQQLEIRIALASTPNIVTKALVEAAFHCDQHGVLSMGYGISDSTVNEKIWSAASFVSKCESINFGCGFNNPDTNSPLFVFADDQDYSRIERVQGRHAGGVQSAIRSPHRACIYCVEHRRQDTQRDVGLQRDYEVCRRRAEFPHDRSAG